MSEVRLYVVEGPNDFETIAFEEGTPNIEEAREAAQRLRGSLVARVFEYSDSELIEDYREGHALDGTPLNSELAEFDRGVRLAQSGPNTGRVSFTVGESDEP